MTELDQLISEIEPAARLVPARALRRAIRSSRDRGDFHTAAVHDRCWRVRKDLLFHLSFPSEFGLDANDPATEFLLIPLPEDPLDGTTRERLQRTLFHAAVDDAFNAAATAETIDSTQVRHFREQLGPARWHAIQSVLLESNLIGPNEANDVVLREWFSLAMEIYYFEPHDWHTFFPGVKLSDEPFRTLVTVIDVNAIFERTHLPGTTIVETPHASAETPRAARSNLSESAVAKILQLADNGNDLLAAIRLSAMQDHRADFYFDRLLNRIRAALEIQPDTFVEWRGRLKNLLPLAAVGGWPPARRVLYELQRACLAIEKTTYSIDVVEWAISFGRAPIVRPLPKTKWLDATRRLRTAARHADRLSDSPHESDELSGLIGAAAAWTERQARDELRPDLHEVLREVGLVPQSTAERHSQNKIVEELLDVACVRGFLRIGDLRDAIARGRVKLDDVSGPREFFKGDPILQMNSKLPVQMPGVYRRGEIYMRLLQRGCSIFFGTRTGRLFTKFIALPFGGAFIILEGLHHMVEAVGGAINWITGWNRTVEGFSVLAGGPAGTLAEHPNLGSSWVNAFTMGALGALLLLLIHWPSFRTAVRLGLKFTFVKFPRIVRHSAVVHFIFKNAFTRFIRRFLLIPLAAGGLAASGYSILIRDWTSAGLVGFGVALFMGSFFRTPWGRRFEDRLDESITRVWRIVSVNFIVGVWTFFIHLFQAIFEAIDRSIYAVDEWLRFQEGDARRSIWLKAVFGVFWFAFTYVFRFAWTLLVEPQINPIKHFPVVTVSHKMLLPLIPSLAKQFNMSEETMGTIVFGIPGIFGFLVWEFKENWKLYRANAPKEINPIVIGSHGEKMRALLRPGFHSGVVPKTFAKLRKAVRTGNAKRAAKYHHSLEHVAESLHHLMTRSFVAYLANSKRWGVVGIRASAPELSPNRIILPIEIQRGQVSFVDGEKTKSPDPFVLLAIEERGGWVIASVADAGPLYELEPDARAAFADALAGFYKLCGVNVIREQAAKVFGPQAFNFDAAPEGLLVPMPDGSLVMHDYDDGPELRTPDRTLPTETIVFSECPLLWREWANRWDDDAAGRETSGSLVPGWIVLPREKV